MKKKSEYLWEKYKNKARLEARLINRYSIYKQKYNKIIILWNFT